MRRSEVYEFRINVLWMYITKNLLWLSASWQTLISQCEFAYVWHLLWQPNYNNDDKQIGNYKIIIIITMRRYN